jgi:hypothetical protein
MIADGANVGVLIKAGDSDERAFRSCDCGWRRRGCDFLAAVSDEKAEESGANDGRGGENESTGGHGREL